MTAYAFGKGDFISDAGSYCELHEISLDFDSSLNEDHLKITGTFKGFAIADPGSSASGQIVLKTTTSNFGVQKDVIIKLNRVLITGSTFVCRPDDHGNVFTLSLTEDAA